ncbi:MAG TPA: hypothetical protein VK886_09915 [Vicinamibacterales bacterium]|nr:hypothetical protein [Vicinamibacterales bacterium]
MHVRSFPAALAAVALLGAAACAPPGPSPNEVNFADEGMRSGAAAARGLTPVALDDLEIGRSLNDDHTIKDAADSFAPADTVYASVRVRGSANSGLVRAQWRDAAGQVIQDDTRIVTPSRGDVVALQAARPQGWKGGRYVLDVYLDNRLVESREFTVEGQPQPQAAPQGH